MTRIIAIASLGVALALAAVFWKNMRPPTDVIAADLVSLPISEIEHRVDAKSLPDQRIEDRTLVFVDPKPVQ
jgi:hypothetical protein